MYPLPSFPQKGCILTVTTSKQGNWDWHTTINSTADLDQITVRPALIKQLGWKLNWSGGGQGVERGNRGRIDSKYLLYSALCQAQKQTGPRRGSWSNLHIYRIWTRKLRYNSTSGSSHQHQRSQWTGVQKRQRWVIENNLWTPTQWQEKMY